MMSRLLSISITLVFLFSLAGCETTTGTPFALPLLNGTWSIELTNVTGTLRLKIENDRIIEYDQGDGDFQEIEEQPMVTESDGRLTFRFLATQAFLGFNNNEPSEFRIDGDGVIQQDGSIEIDLAFTSLKTGEEGVLQGIMRLVE